MPVSARRRRATVRWLLLGAALAALYAVKVGVFVAGAPTRLGAELRRTAGELAVTAIERGGPCDVAGLRRGDRIRAIDGTALDSVFALARLQRQWEPGSVRHVTVRRGSDKLELALRPGSPPPWIRIGEWAAVALALVLLGLAARRQRSGLLGAKLLERVCLLTAFLLAFPRELRTGSAAVAFGLLLVDATARGLLVATFVELNGSVSGPASWLRRLGARRTLYLLPLGLGVVEATIAALELDRAPALAAVAAASGVRAVYLLLGLALPVAAWIRSRNPEERALARWVALSSGAAGLLFAVLEAFYFWWPYETRLLRDLVMPFAFALYIGGILLVLRREARSQESVAIDLIGPLRGAASLSSGIELLLGRIQSAFRARSARFLPIGARDAPDSAASALPIATEIAARVAAPLRVARDFGVALPAAESARLASDGVELLVPLVAAEGTVLGLVLLGSKQSGEEYTGSELKLLRSIGLQAALALERLEAPAPRRAGTEEPTLISAGGAPARECPTCGHCFADNVPRCPEDGALLRSTAPVEYEVGGRYRLTTLLGRGGIGSVFAATDLALEREVAVKVLLGPESAEGRERFSREARLAAGLAHQHIVTVHDFGLSSAGYAFLVLERLRGESLRARLNRGAIEGRLSAAWFGETCGAIGFAHAKGVVHRDLKPENLFLVRVAGGDATIKVLDFGLARTEVESPTQLRTAPGTVIGTFAYMAPEQLLGESAGPAADLFALGVIACELATGARPFRAERPMERLREIERGIAEGEPIFGRSTALGAAIRRAVAYRAEERYGSADELARAIVPRLAECAPGLNEEPTRVEERGSTRGTG